MEELSAEVRDLLSYSGRKGSVMTLFTVFYVLAHRIMGREVFVVWRYPGKPYVWNLQSEELSERPTGDKA
jgi:hypothetical protein